MIGTFCGAALTQAIKLALVCDRDCGNQPYALVRMYVFSRASTGSLPLHAVNLAARGIRSRPGARGTAGTPTQVR